MRPWPGIPRKRSRCWSIPPALGDGQPTRRPSRKRKLTEASGINEALLVPLQATKRSRPSQQLIPVEDAKAALPLVGQPAGSSSSSAVCQLVATADDPTANAGQEQPGQRSGRAGEARPRDILANVEGANIVRDTHLVPGIPGHYDRACVRCPLHSGPCNKTRTFNRRNTARFGQQEPVAFCTVGLERPAASLTGHPI